MPSAPEPTAFIGVLRERTLNLNGENYTLRHSPPKNKLVRPHRNREILLVYSRLTRLSSKFALLAMKSFLIFVFDYVRPS